jgi:hypothetical protein
LELESPRPRWVTAGIQQSEHSTADLEIILKILSWALCGAIGFGIMCFGYSAREQADPRSVWAHGLIMIGPETKVAQAHLGSATPVHLRMLPGNARTEAILKAIETALPSKAPALRAQLQSKLITADLKTLAIDDSSLESGRLPKEKEPEALAGPGKERTEVLTNRGITIKIVGRLKRDYGLFEGCYLIPARNADQKASAEDPAARSATLLQLTREQMRDGKVLELVEKIFPRKDYTWLAPEERLDSRAFFTLICGLAVMLICGSGALISLYEGLARRSQGTKQISSQNLETDGPGAGDRAPWPAWLAAPLLELGRRPRLVWGLHVGYFGLVILGAILVHSVPEIQAVLLSSVQDALSAPSGTLAAAGKAYATGSILRAAGVTFCINFFMGTLLMITVPSVLVPGCGILLATVRSFVWGLLLAPTAGMLAFTMIPHSGTLLLEGEGYILATIFAVLIPIRLFDSRLEGGPAIRFGRALLLNLQASFWVASVLLAAALYEATEVIAMMR